MILIKFIVNVIDNQYQLEYTTNVNDNQYQSTRGRI